VSSLGGDSVVIQRQICVLFVALLGTVALLAFSPGIAWGQPAQDAIDEDAAGAPYAAGELIVTYEEEASQKAVDSIGRAFEARGEEGIPQINARLLEFPEVKSERAREAREEALARIKQTLEQNPAVKAVDYNYVVEASFTPNDPQFDDQWGLRKIRAPKAWDTSKGTGTEIAVLDTGIDTDHPDLQAKIADQEDFVNNDAVAEDRNGHGTHVSGIAAAVTNNAAGVAGTCPDCRLLIGKVLKDDGRGSEFDVADGIRWAADNDVEAINLSLGGRGDSDAVRSAVNYAWNKGSVVVAAAGNDGGNIKIYPAAYAKAIAVAATNNKDKRASLSNYGGWLDVSAPGTGILSTYLSGTYVATGGTSMATPHVAGLAGLLAAKPQVGTATKIRGIVESTAVDRGPVGKDKYHGWGRINAAAAVSCTIVGTIGDDDLDGTLGDDVICALAANDTIRGLGGNDKVFAGPGHDVVRGSGRDTLIGGAGKDQLFGNAGRDRLMGKDGVKGNDYLNGGKGRDRCAADKRDTIGDC